MTTRKHALRWSLLLLAVQVSGLLLQAQQTSTVDSSIYDRLAELEKQAAGKRSGEDHFMVAGLTTIGFNYNKTTITANGIKQSAKTSSFPDDAEYEFSPMLLWRHGQKFLMEFEPSFSSGGQLGINWADVSYFAAPGLIIRAGWLVVPFGTYNKRLAAGWINKLATDPPVADLPPSTDFGIEVEGGLPLGNMKWNYDVSLTNGNQLISNGSPSDGQIQQVGTIDNNLNKMVTARLGLLPISNSSLEVGVSGQFGSVGDAGAPDHSAYEKAFAIDLQYVKLFSPFLVNIKGQYNNIFITSEQFTNAADSSVYTFDNLSTSLFAQASIRPTGSSSKGLKNFELAYRYSTSVAPSGSLWGGKTDISEAAVLYWLNWRTVIKCAYQWNNNNSTALGSQGVQTQSNTLFVQFSIQL